MKNTSSYSRYMVEHIAKGTTTLAIIIRSHHSGNGIDFFTSPELSMQLGYMKRPKDFTINAHKHSFEPLIINRIFETLFIKSGKLHTVIYDENDISFTERILEKGDLIMFTGYGHKFKMLEETEIIEVKQGPYTENKIKIQDVD